MIFDESPDENGMARHQQMVDAEQVWWETRIVNAPTFARFAYRLKQFEALATEVYDNMCPERAAIMSNQILKIVRAYKVSIDAKSSETLRDKQNSQSNLIMHINRNRVERAVTVTGDAKDGIMSGIMGRKAREDAMYD